MSQNELPPEPIPQGRKMTDRDPLINRSDPLREEGFFEGLLRPCIAEFVGTTLFVFVGTMSVVDGNLASVAIAHGFAIALLVAATAKISGGHLNPAVTLGVFLSGGIPVLKSILYIIAQLLGGLTGAALTRGCMPSSMYTNISGGTHTLQNNVSAGEGLLCEVMLTSLLVTAVLLAAMDAGTNTILGPFCIGLAVCADILAGGNISGASMNPARSFGPAVTMSTYNSNVWDYHYIYWLGPAIGALLASIWYRLFLASPERRVCGCSN